MKVLIATDGSDASKSIVEATCEAIAKPENTIVKIISAVEPLAPVTAGPFAVSIEYYGEIEAQAAEHAREFTNNAAKHFRKICPGLKDISCEVIRSVSAARAIVEAAHKWDADLIVVGSHGYGFWSRALLGSVSNSVIHHAQCSVLVVRRKHSPQT